MGYCCQWTFKILRKNTIRSKNNQIHLLGHASSIYRNMGWELAWHRPPDPYESLNRCLNGLTDGEENEGDRLKKRRRKLKLISLNKITVTVSIRIHHSIILCLCWTKLSLSPLQEWFTVLEHYHRLTATVSDLIMGNSYSFRVFSQNKVGISENSAVTKEVATIQKTGDLLLICSLILMELICWYDKLL